jgi:hypothetical protein
MAQTQDHPELGVQHLAGCRLAQVGIGAGLKGAHLGRLVEAAGKHQAGNPAAVGPGTDRLEQLDAVHAGQANVGHQDVRMASAI